jgi:hypothetical protein
MQTMDPAKFPINKVNGALNISGGLQTALRIFSFIKTILPTLKLILP